MADDIMMDDDSVEGLRLQVQILSQMLQEAEDRANEEQAHAIEARRRRLRAESVERETRQLLEFATAETRLHRNRASSAEERANSAEERANSVEERYQQLNDEFDEVWFQANNANESLSNEVRTLQADVRFLNSQRDEADSRAEGRENALRARIQDLERQNDSLQQSASAGEQRATAAEGQLRQVTDQRDEARAYGRLRDLERENFLDELDEANSRIEGLQRENNQVRALLRQEQTNADSFFSQLRKAEKLVRQLREEKRQAEEAEQRADGDADDDPDDDADDDDGSGDNNNENNDLHARIETLEQEKIDLREKAELEASVFRGEIGALNGDLWRSEQQRQELKERCDELTMRSTNLLVQCFDESEKVDALTEKLKRSERLVEQQRQQLAGEDDEDLPLWDDDENDDQEARAQGSINIDHCHLCNALRMVACHDCNKGLACFGDGRSDHNVETVLRAKLYVEDNETFGDARGTDFAENATCLKNLNTMLDTDENVVEPVPWDGDFLPLARGALRSHRVKAGDFRKMFKRQHGVCLVCWRKLTKPQSAHLPGDEKALGTRVDIDHNKDKKDGTKKTGNHEIRGLLCHNCNSGLGFFGDGQAVPGDGSNMPTVERLAKIYSFAKQHMRACPRKSDGGPNDTELWDPNKQREGKDEEDEGEENVDEGEDEEDERDDEEGEGEEGGEYED